MDQESSHTSLVPGHLPKKEEIQYAIGPYQILSSLGKGGMGEVLLAYDTVSGRRIALKKIRDDLAEHKKMQNRFLKEARITSQLTHPAIIPIYTIHEEENLIYYTMPFVQGETLKQILNTTRDQQNKGKTLHHIGGSIQALIRIYLTVCQAVAYAHSKRVLHRDLKPENIIIGPYGEVLILDWGLAKLIMSKEQDESISDEPEPHPLHELTRLGKVVGTVSYMAPERALGNPSTVLTDIYSLGTILYQILSLQIPFQRGTLKEFRKNWEKEKLVDPSEIAPYRDVPRVLARIGMRCLSVDPDERYQSVDDLIRELENYIEGRSEWFQIAELDIHKKSDWEFQENVLIDEHIAITRSVEVSDWVSLMISNASFAGNTKIEAKVRLGKASHSVGFLMSVPEAPERKHLNDGYCLRLGSDIDKSTKLLRSTVEVLMAPEVYLQREKWYHIRIEKVDHNIYFYLNDALQFSYISHIPHIGTHIGLLTSDDDLEIKDFKVFAGSHSITVNCLAVPDAFLAHKDYATALNEYRRIGYSFPDRTEGREALFRAGVTLLDQARHTQNAELFDLALEEFEKLRQTSGAPLEYLGKGLVYYSQKDYEEEAKCFELAYRRYPKHPLLPVLYEQTIYRMHEYSRYHRKATYLLILSAVRHLPKETLNTKAGKLFESLQKHWEPLYFIEKDEDKNNIFAIQLAFWLARPYALMEIIEELDDPITLNNGLFCLIELGWWKLAETELKGDSDLLKIAIQCHRESVFKAIDTFFSIQRKELSYAEERIIWHLMECALNENQPQLVHKIVKRIANDSFRIQCYQIWAYLLENKLEQAGQLLNQYSLDTLTQETTLLHTLYGCWLFVTEGKEIADVHFSGVLEVPYPRSWLLLSHYLNGRLDQNWFDKAFMWEKRQLYRQLVLFYHCIGDVDKVKQYRKLEKQEVPQIDADSV